MSATGSPGEALRILVEAVQRDASGRAIGAVGAVDDSSERGAPWNGKRVLVGASDACGECDVCRRGGAPVCPRSVRRDFAAREVSASSRWLVALGDGLDVPGAAAAAIAGDVALAYTLYARTSVAPRDPVVVVGGDAVARFLVEVLVAKGIAPVVIDRGTDAAWTAWLVARGAGVARVAAGEDARAAVNEALVALAQDSNAGKRPWRVIATGDVALAAGLAGPRATLTTCAPGGGGDALAAALAREVSLLGVSGPHPDLVLEAAALVVKGEIDLAAGVTVRRADEPAPAPSTRSDAVVSV